MTALAISELTGATVASTGIFDVLMKAVKAHLDGEFKAGKIKGPEYATVYLGSLDLAMQTGLTFLLQQRKNDIEAQLLAQQLQNAVAEGQNISKQGTLLDAQTAQVTQQTVNLVTEKAATEAKTAQATQQTENLVAEAANIPKQGQVIDAQKAQLDQTVLNMVAEKLGIEAKTQLTSEQTANAVIEGTVLVAQECKLRAEFDFTEAQTLKSTEELALLTQKTATEKAQTIALGVDDNSVVGRQKALYQSQSDGFKRDAEQKAAKLLVDTWSVRRSTDEATVADGTNLLNDATVGRAVTKLLSGVGA